MNDFYSTTGWLQSEDSRASTMTLFVTLTNHKFAQSAPL